LPLLALGALGVIYGDIGTSPLYAMQVAFSSAFGMEPNRQDILGILSMFIWALIIVVTIKYVIIVTRANNKGEGGDLASFPRRVFALLHRHAQVSTDFFHVPPDHTVTMGARVEI